MSRLTDWEWKGEEVYKLFKRIDRTICVTEKGKLVELDDTYGFYDLYLKKDLVLPTNLDFNKIKPKQWKLIEDQARKELEDERN